jgi:nucleotide-binding universal stress UspA family protein
VDPIVRNVLAAIDFSPVSTAVIELAASLAETFSAKLTLVHVAAPDPAFIGYEPGPQTVRDARAHELRVEHGDLQEIAKRLRDRGIAAHALMIQGPSVEKIISEAKQIEADVIVVGSHGHGALHRTLLGSVSEGIMRGARCPVLVLPAAPSTDP